MEKSRFDNYIDGVVKICEKIEKKSNFRANINVTTMDDLKVIAKMNYQKMSRRIQDVEFAKSNGFELTMKIKIRKIKNITSDNVVVIENKMHSIKHIDDDGNTNLYLYLQGERELNGRK
ncbi:phage head closure protein [Eubacterium sp.]|uniref:phage head closure protein n=1 Tax=Eubacterium TaxID=1730 RepID=UPI003992260F